MYKLAGVTKDYPKGSDIVHALRGVAVVIPDGEWLAIQGPTGHGKTTLGSLTSAIARRAQRRGVMKYGKLATSDDARQAPASPR